MNKLIFSILATAMSASACAQMPAALIDGRAHDILSVMPRKASDPCPAFARFRFVTTDVTVQSAASVCSTDTCLLLPPGQAMGSSDTTTKINREIEALQGCDTTSQTCQTQAGTVGESIKTQKSN